MIGSRPGSGRRRATHMQVAFGLLTLVILSGGMDPGAALALGTTPASSVSVPDRPLGSAAPTLVRVNVTADGQPRGTQRAARRGVRIVEAHACQNPQSLGSALVGLWADTFAPGSWFSDHPKHFLAVVTRPMRVLTRQCGGEFAYEVASQTNLVGPTWRALTSIIDRYR
jgi:hypothetical protein